VFYSDDNVPVEIYGVVEDCMIDMFSKDLEMKVSVVCPDPYFTAVDPVVVTGESGPAGGDVRVINYNGTIETGFRLKSTFIVGGENTSDIVVQVGNPVTSRFEVVADVTATKYFDMSSIAMQKYVQNVNLDTGVITNLLNGVVDGSDWPTLQPGENNVQIFTSNGGGSPYTDWELTYFERFGGL
jgi:hypothetical protein